MNPVDLENKLAGLPLGKIRYFDSIGSTNDYAIYWLQYGPPNLSVVIANEQTSGRGRAGRQWLTPRGAALAVSVILYPDQLQHTHLAMINGLGALAVSEALLKLGLSPSIKWPNDVLLNRQKVAGILPEAQWLGDTLRGVVLGIGINVQRAAVPPAEMVSFPAGCIEEALGQPVPRELLLREVLDALISWIACLGQPSFLKTWENRLAFQDEPVKLVPSSGEPVEGRLLGLTPEGNVRLLVGQDEQVFMAGEIRLRPLVESKQRGG